LVLNFGELLVDFVVQVVEVGSDFLFGLGGKLELHLRKLVDDVGGLVLDLSHRLLGLGAGSGLEHLDAVLVELHN